MMNVLIIEDEPAAAARLQKLIKEILPQAHLLAHLDSIEEAVQWFKKNSQPDLLFLDIQLADGLAFDIFSEVIVNCPVIFTTAYDQYALEAFSVNSIDYLLKPVKKEALQKSIEKLQSRTSVAPESVDFSKLAALLQQPHRDFQKRFLVKFGQHLKTIDAMDAAYFFTEEKNVFLTTSDGRHYPIDQSLEKLEQSLDPAIFYRINRKFIINMSAIADMFTYSKSRVKLVMNPPYKEDIIISTERSSDFKQWLAGEKKF